MTTPLELVLVRETVFDSQLICVAGLLSMAWDGQTDVQNAAVHNAPLWEE